MIRNALLALLICLATPAAQAGAYDDILHAANQNETDKVVDLLRRGMDVNTSDMQGSTLLMIAARSGNASLTRFLLENRVNMERRNQYGDTALMLAAMQGHKEIVELILERKPEINHSGWNPLHYAAFGGRSEIIALLLAAGADPNLKAPNAHTALMLAAKHGHLEAVRVLSGARADPAIRDPEEGTALDMARKAGNTDIAAFLQKLGR
jgi:ankyrin repeat protein